MVRAPGRPATGDRAYLCMQRKRVCNNKNIKRWSRESEHKLLGSGKRNIEATCTSSCWSAVQASDPSYRSNIVNLPRCSCPLLSAFSCFAAKFNNFRYSADDSQFSEPFVLRLLPVFVCFCFYFLPYTLIPQRVGDSHVTYTVRDYPILTLNFGSFHWTKKGASTI